MKNLKFNSIFTSVAVLLAIPLTSYAEDVDLPCCAGGACPTMYVSEGMPGVQQGATMKGIKPNPDGEIITMYRGAPGYDKWIIELRSMSDKGYVRNILGASQRAAALNVSILAKCSSGSNWVNLSDPGMSITCTEGEGIMLRQSSPTCNDPATGPRSVVTITRETAEERVERLQKKAYGILDELEGLDKQIATLDDQIAEGKKQISACEDRILHGGKITSTLSVSAFGDSSGF